MKKLAVIIGAGHGMGNNIAERFAKKISAWCWLRVGKVLWTNTPPS